MSANLMLHCGGNTVERDSIRLSQALRDWAALGITSGRPVT